MTSEQKYKQLGADYHWTWAAAGDANPYVRWLKRVLGYLPDAPGATLLDVGCGDGYPASLLVARGYLVTGVDVYEPALAVARERVPAAVFDTPADVQAEGFDYVLAFEAIEHMDSPQMLVDAARDCGQFALVSCPEPGWDSYAAHDYTTAALTALFEGSMVEVLVDEGEHRLYKVTPPVRIKSAPEPDAAPKRGKRAARRAE